MRAASYRASPPAPPSTERRPRRLPDLPPELWWKIAVIAGNVRAARRLCTAVARLRPERSLLAGTWVGLFDDEDLRRGGLAPGAFLRDLHAVLEEAVWPDRACRQHRAMYARHRDALPRSAYLFPLERPITRRRRRRVHEVYRVPESVVQLLRDRPVVFALVY